MQNKWSFNLIIAGSAQAFSWPACSVWLVHVPLLQSVAKYAIQIICSGGAETVFSHVVISFLLSYFFTQKCSTIKSLRFAAAFTLEQSL